LGGRVKGVPHQLTATQPRAILAPHQTEVKIMLKHFRWDDVERDQVNPMFERQLVVGDKVMLSRILLQKGALVPLHHHENEQITYILKGALKFGIDGRDIVVKTGEVLCIPPNMPHSAEALEETVDLDIFYPPRADWLAKTDQYLRGAGVATPRR
jgi:quercetin dioxygenase-like cupin family protein